MPIELLIKKYKRMSGQARYAMSLSKGMGEIGVEFSRCHPTYPLLMKGVLGPLKGAGIDLAEFFASYPMTAPLSKNSVKHLTIQQMGTLLFFQPRLTKTVITVHDIIPYIFHHQKNQSSYQNPLHRLFDKLSLMGIKKAQKIIAISEFTKKTLVETLSVPQDKIEVVLYGLDQEVFRPVNISESFRTRYNLPTEYRYVLYVGSEVPRKNLSRLIQAFAQLKSRMPKVKLIKVGTPEYPLGHQQLQKLIEDLSLKDDVLFYNHPGEEDLINFYNVGDLFAFPSLYEGFGMPPLEAMACGTPVMSSHAASLPEVVGDAALIVDPYDTNAMAETMYQILSNPSLQEELRHKGIERAQTFTWQRAARETVAVYQKALRTTM